MQMVLDIPSELSELLANVKGNKESFIIKKMIKELKIMRGDSFTMKEIEALDFTEDELNRIGFTQEEIEDIQEGLKDIEGGRVVSDNEMDAIFNDIENGKFQ